MPKNQVKRLSSDIKSRFQVQNFDTLSFAMSFSIHVYERNIHYSTSNIIQREGWMAVTVFFYFFDKIKIYNYIDVEYRILISEILGFYK